MRFLSCKTTKAYWKVVSLRTSERECPSCELICCLFTIFSMEVCRLALTSVGLSISPGWETPFSPGLPTGIMNPGLKAPHLVPVPRTGTESGPLVPVAITNQD